MPRKYKVAIIAFLAGFSIDQLTKFVVKAALEPAGRVSVISQIIELRYAENTGMIFGMLQELDPSWRVPFFSSIALVAALIIIHLLRQAPPTSIRLSAGLGLILAGAFGNLADRLHWGFVVDFVRVKVWPPANYHWPTFNMADACISLGIALLLIDSIFAIEGRENPEPQAQSLREGPGPDHNGGPREVAPSTEGLKPGGADAETP